MDRERWSEWWYTTVANYIGHYSDVCQDDTEIAGEIQQGIQKALCDAIKTEDGIQKTYIVLRVLIYREMSMREAAEHLGLPMASAQRLKNDFVREVGNILGF